MNKDHLAEGDRTAVSDRAWKCGNEFLPFHPDASHVPPDYRDGWNDCYSASIRAALSRGFVPLSDDGRCVFIVGIGEVPLVHFAPTHGAQQDGNGVPCAVDHTKGVE